MSRNQDIGHAPPAAMAPYRDCCELSAPIASRARTTLDRCGGRAFPTRAPHRAEDQHQRRQPISGSTDEERRVAVASTILPHSGSIASPGSLQSSQQRIERTEQRVLRRRVGRVRQRRHVGDERDAGDAVADVVDADDRGERAEARRACRDVREGEIRRRPQDPADQQRWESRSDVTRMPAVSDAD